MSSVLIPDCLFSLLHTQMSALQATTCCNPLSNPSTDPLFKVRLCIGFRRAFLHENESERPMLCKEGTTHCDDLPDPLDIVSWEDTWDPCAKALTLEPAILALFTDSVVVSLAQFNLIVFLWSVVVHCYVPVWHMRQIKKWDSGSSGVASCARPHKCEAHPRNNADLNLRRLMVKHSNVC